MRIRYGLHTATRASTPPLNGYDTYMGMLHLAVGIIIWFHALLPR